MTDAIRIHQALRVGLAALICAMLIAAPVLAQSQPPAPAKTEDNFFKRVGRWFDDSFSSVGSHFKSAEKGVENFNREAGAAAKATGGAVKDAADAVVKLPTTRVVTGHQTCTVAANGAPNCQDAANKLCQGKGFAFGSSIDITAAEECPVRVATGQREAKPGECKNVTFVSRAMCQ